MRCLQLEEADTVGDFAGRIQTDDPTSLTISDVKSSDHGSYECEVRYPTGGGRGQARINVVGVPNPVGVCNPSPFEK